MSRLVTLVAWEDATKKPPTVERSAWYPTDIGACYYGEALGMWLATGGRPQPAVWCDPVPPGPDALTVEKLTHIYHLAWAAPSLQPEERKMLEEFRAALDALGNGGTE